MGKRLFERWGNRFRGTRQQERGMANINVINVSGQPVAIRLEEVNHLEEQMEFIKLSEEDLRLIKSLQPLVKAHLDELTTAFYDALYKVEELKELIYRHSTVERLKQTLSTHLMEMFDGKIDAAFVEKRLRIARTHIRIGLETKWYMGAFQNLYRFITDLVAAYVPSKEEQIMFNHVIGKLINFEQQLVLEAYEKENLIRQEKMYTEIKEEIKRKIAAVSEEATVVAQKNEAAVHQLEKSSEHVHRSFERFMAKIQEVRNMTSVGKEQLRQLSETVNRIGVTSAEMEKTLNQFISSYEIIQQMMFTVQNIAKRTNLLSLNAAIEASRGGAQNGFHIIAKEVRKLSEDTRQSIEQMSRLVERLNVQTKDVSASAEEVRSQLNVAKKESVETRTAFEQIDSMMDITVRDIQQMAAEMEALYEVIHSMNAAATQVAASLNMLRQTTQNL